MILKHTHKKTNKKQHSPTAQDADLARQEGYLCLRIAPSMFEHHSTTHMDAAPTNCLLLPHINGTMVKLGYDTIINAHKQPPQPTTSHWPNL